MVWGVKLTWSHLEHINLSNPNEASNLPLLQTKKFIYNQYQIQSTLLKVTFLSRRRSTFVTQWQRFFLATARSSTSHFTIMIARHCSSKFRPMKHARIIDGRWCVAAVNNSFYTVFIPYRFPWSSVIYSKNLYIYVYKKDEKEKNRLPFFLAGSLGPLEMHPVA